MKLLVVSDNFAPRWDGIARFLVEVIPRLKGFEITLAVPDFGESPDLGLRTEKFEAMNRKVGDFPPVKPSRKVMNKMKRLVKNNDVVFINSSGLLGFIALLYSKKKPKIAYTHTIEWELVSKAIGIKILKPLSWIASKLYAKWFYNKFDLLIVPSQAHAEILKWYNIKPKKSIIKLGVDSQIFTPAKDKYTAKKRMGLEENYVVGYHGRIAREKGIISLLRAFVQFSGYNKKAKLVIVGDGVDSLKTKLVQKKALITGFVDNPVPWLQAMDVYVMPSLVETTCLSLLEAMASGLPCITTRVGYVQEYLKNNYNGLFFPKKDSYTLYKKLQYLSNNPKKALTFGKNARKTAEKYCWESTAKSIEKEINRIINKS